MPRRIVHACMFVEFSFLISYRTPPKRSRHSFARSLELNDCSVEIERKRFKERVLSKPIPSYTDPDPAHDFELPPFNPDDIDGVPIDSIASIEDTNMRSTTVFLPIAQNRPLIRRATDFPLLQASESDDHAPSPRSAEVILDKVLGIGPQKRNDPVAIWRQRRNEYKCPLCLDVLVRPVDVAGCGHLVCRTHVIDLYQFCGSKAGIRCPVCRKEDRVDDFNKIQVDQEKWRLIQRAQFHSARRKSISPSRSLTPLRDRFNRKFLQDNDF
jgi:hypothetical protein